MLAMILSTQPRFSALSRKYKHVLVTDSDECLLKGIVFLGTPFAGSLKANLISPFIKILASVNPRPMGQKLVDDLKYVKDGNGDLASISAAANIVIHKYDIEILIGCETQPVPHTGRGPVGLYLPS